MRACNGGGGPACIQVCNFLVQALMMVSLLEVLTLMVPRQLNEFAVAGVGLLEVGGG